jgi:hypothetical protein
LTPGLSVTTEIDPRTICFSSRDGSELPPEGERMFSCSYGFVARNSSELSVLQGETLEVFILECLYYMTTL